MELFPELILAKSKAGHDIGKIYVIVNEDEEYVYLSDGDLKPLERMKKKKKKHIQVIKNVPKNIKDIFKEQEVSNNELIRTAVKLYKGKFV